MKSEFLLLSRIFSARVCDGEHKHTGIFMAILLLKNTNFFHVKSWSMSKFFFLIYVWYVSCVSWTNTLQRFVWCLNMFSNVRMCNTFLKNIMMIIWQYVIKIEIKSFAKIKQKSFFWTIIKFAKQKKIVTKQILTELYRHNVNNKGRERHKRINVISRHYNCTI